MRTTDTLLALEEIPILWQYLYMSENHRVIIDNGVTNLEIRMTDGCNFLAKNLRFPSVPEMSYNDMMTIPNMLGIIDQLKDVPPVEYPNAGFKSRWDEISTITMTNVTQNKMKKSNWLKEVR